MAEDVNYQPVSPEPEKACEKCKHFECDCPEGACDCKEGVMGKCFGHEVSCQGTCNFFETK